MLDIVPIDIALRPSAWLRRALVAAHCLGAAATLWIDIPHWAKALLIIAVAASAWFYLRRLAAPLPRLHVDTRGRFSVETSAGGARQATVLPGSVVTPYAAILSYRVNDLPRPRVRYLLLCADMLDEEAFRRLRVWLRFGAARAGDAW